MEGKIETIRCAAGVWRWMESRTEAEYVNWDQSQPDNANNGNEDCVERRNRFSELWNDRPCDYSVPHALCQAKK